MLVTSIFSFSYNVFYPSKKQILILSHIYFFVCRSFEFELAYKNLLFGKVEINLSPRMLSNNERLLFPQVNVRTLKAFENKVPSPIA